MKRKTGIAILLILTICISLIFSGCYALIKVPDEHYETAQSTLINTDADECAVELMEYLKSIYGKYTLSGQYINEYEDFDLPYFRQDPSDPLSPRTVFRANELQAVYGVTGEYPALLGVDLSGIECGDRCFSVEQAEENGTTRAASLRYAGIGR